MTKAELIKEFKKRGINNADKVFEVYSDILAEAIKKGEDVAFPFIGKFKYKFRPDRYTQVFGKMKMIKASHLTILRQSIVFKRKLK